MKAPSVRRAQWRPLRPAHWLQRAHWRHVPAELFLVVAVSGGAVAYGGVLRGWAWLYAALVVIVTTVAGAALARAFRLHPVLVALTGLIGWTAGMDSMFFRDASFLGVVPTADTLGAARDALDQAWHTVAYDAVPAAPNIGIVALTAGALGLIALVTETIALSCRMPAVSGAAVLAALVVPAVLKPESVGATAFATAAAGYLGLLAMAGSAHSGSSGERLAAALSPGRFAVLVAAVVAGALVVPQVIPGFNSGTFPEGSRLQNLGQNVGLNPLITLGSDLRSSTAIGLLRYATDSKAPVYLRTVTVEDFNGGSWGPENHDDQLQRPIAQITGTGAATVPSTTTTTVVTTGGFTSPYLPAPYAPQSFQGVRGDFGWDPSDLSVKGPPASSQNQLYVVRSSMPQLTPEALAAAVVAPRGVDLVAAQVPRGVPANVRAAAEQVTQSATTAYARALKIQAWLRTFEYSEKTPLENGYDGTGMDVLSTFLIKKSGYCIHFAAAMAVMARVVGIPSRIAVGFAPGHPTGQTVAIPSSDALPEYQVDGRDAHAWPELYFQGLGWVPFEPTPTRGVLPSYAFTDAAGPGGSTNLDNLNDGLRAGPNGASAAPAPSQSAAPASVPNEPTPWIPAVLVALGVLVVAIVVALPAALRAAQRRRRLNRGLRGIWEELEAVGLDHGLAPGPADTPRSYANRLGAWGGDDGGLHRALDTLTTAYERQEFGRPGYEADEEAARRAVAVVHEAGRLAQRPVHRARIAALPPSSFAWITRALTRLAPAAEAAGARMHAVLRRALRRPSRRGDD
jgi:transglutaminase-like putative cysteine protease